MDDLVSLPETEVMLTLSTAHCTADDDRLLSSAQRGSPITVSSYDGGHLIKTTAMDEPETAEDMAQIGYSPSLIELVRSCRRAGVSWLRLDCDAPIVRGLPVFDW